MNGKKIHSAHAKEGQIPKRQVQDKEKFEGGVTMQVCPWVF